MKKKIRKPRRKTIEITKGHVDLVTFCDDAGYCCEIWGAEGALMTEQKQAREIAKWFDQWADWTDNKNGAKQNKKEEKK